MELAVLASAERIEMGLEALAFAGRVRHDHRSSEQQQLFEGLSRVRHVVEDFDGNYEVERFTGVVCLEGAAGERRFRDPRAAIRLTP